MTTFDWQIHFENVTPGLTEAELLSTEQLLGLRLPGELRELYAAVGKGMFRHQDFLNADDFEYNLFELLGAGGAPDAESELIDYYRSLVADKRIIATNHVPFAVGAGGDVYSVACEDGSVWFWPMDGDPAPRVVTRSIRELLESAMRGQ